MTIQEIIEAAAEPTADNAAAVDLALYAENYGNLYYQLRAPIEENLQKHIARGDYDNGEAFAAFFRFARIAAIIYADEFPEHDKILTATKRAVAYYFLYRFEAENNIKTH